jgi:hypothetical protein
LWSFDVAVSEAKGDRVLASIRLASDRPGQAVDGVTLQLLSAEGEELSPKFLLPVSGSLFGPVTTSVELRSRTGALPSGAEVVGTAWWSDGQLTVRRSTDPRSSLFAHARPSRPRLPMWTDALIELIPEERAVLSRLLPWTCVACVPRPLDAETDESPRPELPEDLDLDPGDAEWLRDLLTEDG